MSANSPPEDGGATGVVSPALIGRAGELRRLLDAMSAPPSVVVIEGEAGIGKSRLVSELRRHPAVAQRRFLVGSCRRIKEPFPLGPVLEAMRWLSDDLATVPLSPVVGSLRPLLPELARVLPERPEALDDRAAERHRVFRGLVEVLAALGETTLVLEDLHWADPLTFDLVHYLLADPPERLCVVVTFRREDAQAGVGALTSRLPPSVRRVDAVLTPLDAAGTGALAAAILGIDHVSDDFAGYLHARSSGLPLAIEELVALLRERGTLVRRGGGWARRAVEELAVPAGIRDSVLERLGRLSVEARALAETAAVLQEPVTVQILAATSGEGSPRAGEGIDGALGSGLLVENEGRIGFRHVLAAQAVYEAIPAARRRDLHARAACELEDVDTPPLGQLAHHLRCADKLGAWIDVAERAADQAAELGEHGEVVRLLEEVLREAPLDAQRRGGLAVKLGRAAVEALPDREVLSLLSDAVTDDTPRHIRGELRFLTAVLLDRHRRDVPLQRRLCEEAVEDLGGRPDLQAWAMVSLGIPIGPEVELSEHLHWLHRALGTVPEIDDPIFQVFVLGKAASVLAGVGDPSWRSVADRIRDLTGGAPRQRREVNAYYSVAVGACCAGHHRDAAELLDAGLEVVLHGDNRRLELMLRSARALVDYCSGSWTGLAERAGLLAEELADYTPAHSLAEVVGVCLSLSHGDLDGGEGQLPDVVERVGELGGLDIVTLPTTALVRLRLARGDISSALAVVDRFVDEVASVGVWSTIGRVLPVAVEAMVAAGELERARALLRRVETETARLDVPLVPPAMEHASGHLEAGGRRWDAAADHHLRAAAGYEGLSSPYQAAQAYEHAANCRSSAGRLADGAAPAAELLQAAMGAYGRLGATWDLTRAARSARSQGVPVPARHRGGRRGYGDALSPRETEVARLLAAGQSNKAIAAALFISVKTVERHVTAVMRKLQVRSRAAVAHRLAEDPDLTTNTAGGPAPKDAGFPS